MTKENIIKILVYPKFIRYNELKYRKGAKEEWMQ